jgi:hypothetical protein
MPVIANPDISQGVSANRTILPIDIVVAGLPGQLLDWTIDILARAATRHQDAAPLLPIGGQTAWSPRDPDKEPAVRLFVGDCLSAAWVTPIRDGHIAAVLVLDDISLVWGRLREIGQQPAQAIHGLVTVATSFGDAATGARVLTVTDAARIDPRAMSARILTHVGLRAEIPDEVVEALRTRRPPQTLIDDAPRPLLEAVIKSAFEYGRGNGRVPVIWPRECLLWGDNPGEALPRILDLTGPSRILAYGPYLPLPPGKWTMSATFAFSPASRGASLSLGLYGSAELARMEFTVERPGLFKASSPITVLSSLEHLEIRFVTERGAIEGTIGIDGIVFTPK